MSYKNFFRRVKQGAGKKGFPRFKSKHRSKKKFRLTGSIRVLKDQIQLPRLGRLHLKEKGYLPINSTPDVRILSATVRERAGGWYVSVQIDSDQTLSDFMYVCDCGLELDRDHNAAINI